MVKSYKNTQRKGNCLCLEIHILSFISSVMTSCTYDRISFPLDLNYIFHYDLCRVSHSSIQSQCFFSLFPFCTAIFFPLYVPVVSRAIVMGSNVTSVVLLAILPISIRIFCLCLSLLSSGFHHMIDRYLFIVLWFISEDKITMSYYS